MGWRELCVVPVSGDPKGQPRPRAFSRGGKASVYDPGTAEGWKGQIAMGVRPYIPATPYAGPLRIDCIFFFRRPKSLMRAKDYVGYMPYCRKPDRDNLDKAVLDCLTQIGMIADDALVFSGLIEKWYVPKNTAPGAVIKIFSLENWMEEADVGR